MTVAAEVVRATLVDALEEVEAAGSVARSALEAFAAGAGDIPLAELGLDSVVRMELLVALELEHDVVILPDVFAGFRTLGDIAAFVAGGGGGAAPGAAPSAPGAHASTPAPRVARVFRRGMRQARTVAALDLFVSRLVDVLSPPEVAALRDVHARGGLLPEEASSKHAEAVSLRLDALGRLLRAAGKAAPEPFERRRLGPAATLYAGPGERAGKTLLVGFSVLGARSLALPNPVLLQHLDAARHDVLIVSDPWGTAFRGGVPGMGPRVEDVVRRVAELGRLSEYGARRAFGCSAGVFPAMLLGRRVGAELTVGFAGRFPSERHLATLVRMYGACWGSARRHRGARVLLVHDAAKSRDAAYARRLRWLTGASQLAVELPGTALGHLMLPPLVDRGRLGDLLERSLLADVGTEGFAGPGACSTLRLTPGR